MTPRIIYKKDIERRNEERERKKNYINVIEFDINNNKTVIILEVKTIHYANLFSTFNNHKLL
jgi:hypothetical protein